MNRQLVNSIAVEAGLVSGEYNGFDRQSLTNAELRFAELLVNACINECRNVSYAAMQIELDTASQQIDFDRGVKSGRKFGAIACAQQIADKFDAHK